MNFSSSVSIASLAAVALVVAVPSEAHASSCGDDYQYVATDVSITVDPSADCIEARILGANQPGCDQLELLITSSCSGTVDIWTKDAGVDCSIDPCSSLATGETAHYLILTEAPGEYDIHMELSLEGQALTLDASFEVIDQAQNSCAVADVGSRDGGGRSTLVAALGLIFGAAARRARRATTRHRTGDKKTSSGT